MNGKKTRILTAIALCILFACGLCAAAFAENETVPGEEDIREAITHRLWGFFSSWAEGDTDGLPDMCSAAWRKEQEDPGQALGKILGSGAPCGYRIDSIAADESGLLRTVAVTLQWDAGEGGYTYSRHEIICRPDPDGYFGFDPDGLEAGVPAEPVPAEELIPLTREGIIRECMELHGDEGIYDQLIPVGAAAEAQGFRMEVISGLVRGRKAWFLVSMQDTEGTYSGFNMDSSFADNIDGSYSRSWARVYSSGADNTTVYLFRQELDRQMQPEDGDVSVGISEVWINEEKRIDLLPLLEQYGKTEEGAAPPLLDNYGFDPERPSVPEDVKILDYTQPLEIPLSGGVCLTGIGWIDGQLHVQFHNGGMDFVNMRSGRGSAWSAWAYAYAWEKAYEDTFVDYSPLRWDGNNDGWPDWNEYIFNCGPEETEQMEAYAEITVTQAILEEDWTVRVPLDLVCEATDPEPAETAGESTAGTEAENGGYSTGAESPFLQDMNRYSMWEFFRYWAQADTDNLPNSLTDAQKYGGAETEALIAGLLAEGTPLAYQVGGVSAEENGAVRKYTCTVLMDPGEGGEPEYRLYEVRMRRGDWFYAVDLAGLACLGPAEADPNAETVSLTTEAMISDYLDYFNPGIRKELRPVGLACEKNGIRMELISGLVKDREAWFIYSLQDLEGKYDDYSCDVFDMQEDAGTTASFSTAPICRDRKENKIYMIWNPRYESPVRAEEREVTLELGSVSFSRNVLTDLAPLLKQYGGTAESVPIPEQVYHDGEAPENLQEMRVLDYTRPLDIPLLENTSVTGIGWVDGLLHVQIRLNNPVSWSMGVDATAPGRGNIAELPYSPLEWFSDSSEWVEYVFDCSPEDAGELSLTFNGSIGQERANGPWEVRFPLSAVCPGTGSADASAAEGKIVYDPKAGGCVYTLDGITYLLNGDGTATVLENGAEGGAAAVPETIEIRFTVNRAEEE